MRIASEYIDRDESRERAGSVATMVAMNHVSSSATRVAMNFGMFDCDEDRNECATSSNARSEQSATSEARRLARLDCQGLIRCARANQSLAKKSKKRNQQSTRL